MDFLRLIILMFVELLHTSHQVNDHPEGINSLLDKLIKDTETRFSYNKTTTLKEKPNKNLNDSKILYVRTQVDPDILFKSNITENSPELNTYLEDGILVENKDDEIEKFGKDKQAKNDYFKSENKMISRRTYDRINSDEVYSEVIEENMTDIEDEDVIFEKEITYDITENTHNQPKPNYQLSSLNVTRSGSGIEEDVIDRMADADKDPNIRNPQFNGENLSISDVKKLLSSWNTLNNFNKDSRENKSDSDIGKLLSLFKSNHSETSQLQQTEHSKALNSSPILENSFNDVLGQILNNRKLKPILESLKLDRPRNADKSTENMLPEVDMDKVKKNLKILEEWDKKYNKLHSTELQQNQTETKQQPQPKEHQNYDIYRNGLDVFPRVRGHLFTVPKAHFIPPLTNPRYIFSTQNRIKCCTHTNVIGNPLLGILPAQRLGLINSVKRMMSGFVYNPLYYRTTY